MASRARARSTCAEEALSERLRRVKAIRSSGVSGRRGSFRWRDMGHLGARGSPIIIPEPAANDPLSSDLLVVPRMAASFGVERGHGFLDGALEVIRAGEGLVSEVMALQVAPENL